MIEAIKSEWVIFCLAMLVIFLLVSSMISTGSQHGEPWFAISGIYAGWGLGLIHGKWRAGPNA